MRLLLPASQPSFGALSASCKGKAPALHSTNLSHYIGQVMRCGHCWDSVWDKSPEETRLSDELHKDEEEVAVVVPHHPKQHCSALGLGMSCFEPRREFLSPSPDEKG